jgi:hypothetical protein
MRLNIFNLLIYERTRATHVAIVAYAYSFQPCGGSVPPLIWRVL